MSVREEDIRRWARLSRLDLTEEELQRISGDLEEILSFVRSLQKVETNLPGESAVPRFLRPRERPDVAGESLDRELALRETAFSAEGFFTVPAVVESEARFQERTRTSPTERIEPEGGKGR